MLVHEHSQCNLACYEGQNCTPIHAVANLVNESKVPCRGFLLLALSHDLDPVHGKVDLFCSSLQSRELWML